MSTSWMSLDRPTGKGASSGVDDVQVGENVGCQNRRAGPVGGGDYQDGLPRGKTRVGRPAVCKSGRIIVVNDANGSCGSFIINNAGEWRGSDARWRTDRTESL